MARIEAEIPISPVEEAGGLGPEEEDGEEEEEDVGGEGEEGVAAGAEEQPAGDGRRQQAGAHVAAPPHHYVPNCNHRNPLIPRIKQIKKHPTYHRIETPTQLPDQRCAAAPAAAGAARIVTTIHGRRIESIRTSSESATSWLDRGSKEEGASQCLFLQGVESGIWGTFPK